MGEQCGGLSAIDFAEIYGFSAAVSVSVSPSGL
jgi:hypothetical protein